jgi:hypothetical protein
MRWRSVSLGFGPVPIGNCFGAGLAPHPDCMVAATPQRMVAAFVFTMENCVKSRPVGSLALWHETQYIAKKPCA